MFRGFYTPSKSNIKKSWSDTKTLFVFDTNVLLNLYRYTETTRNDFFNIIENISEKIWLPYHVGLEYQRNRLTVIKNEKAIFNNLHIYLKDLEKNIETSNLQELKLNQRLPELDKATKEMQDGINQLIENYKEKINEWNKKQPDVRSSDKIRKKIDKIFNNKIGNPPSEQKWLDDLYKEGERRYTLHLPPGYMDKKDKETKSNYIYGELEYIPMYGDLIIWKQIIEKVKDEDIESLIFVTDDVKEDWWYILNSNGKKEIGARAELRDEIYSTSKIKSFELLRTTDFMKNGQEILELAVNDTSITEAKVNFENKQKIYNLKLNKDIAKKIKALKSDSLNTDFEKISKKYLKNMEKYENKIELDNHWLEIIKNNHINENNIYDESFYQPTSSEKYLSIMEEIKQEKQLQEELEIEKLLEKIKKIEEYLKYNKSE